MSSLQVDNIQSYNANPPLVKNVSGNQVGTFCRAWVNFNGTGTVAIRQSFNVSSITDNATGDYTVNFVTALADADYSSFASVSFGSGGYSIPQVNTNSSAVITAPTTSSMRFAVVNYNGTAWSDPTYAQIAIFR